jgi:hypothetical protein
MPKVLVDSSDKDSTDGDISFCEVESLVLININLKLLPFFFEKVYQNVTKHAVHHSEKEYNPHYLT